MPRKIEDRLASLLKTQEKARAIAPLVENEQVQEFFSALKERLADELVTCAPHDDDGRRNRAYLLHAVNSLDSFITSTAKGGERAEAEYAKLIEFQNEKATQ